MPRRLIALGEWLMLGALVGVLCGVASAVFLLLLDRATAFRTSHETIIWTMPIAALVIGLIYERWGKPIKGGSNLILDAIHDGGPLVPLRMAPMVLIGTVLTHLFGGSAGREGTAVQMGASLAEALGHRLGLTGERRRHLLAAGVAGGFGSVFGTPIAGAIFGLEFVALGSFDVAGMLPALVASLVGDEVTRALGVVHTPYPLVPAVPLTPRLVAVWVLFAVCVALTASAFIELTHGIKRVTERRIPRLPLRMALGAVVLIVLWQGSGTSDYLGLGVPTIVRAFSDPSVPAAAFALKLVFTAITIGVGFLGGEVTPLFFVGATLGGLLARMTGLPLELGAGVGLAAVFGAASNAPIALTIMAVELLGANVLPHAAIVCVLAYVLTGHRSLYPSQRVARMKLGRRLSAPVRMSELDEDRDR
jgi:H+/Cl- antiporter ClcA